MPCSDANAAVTHLRADPLDAKALDGVLDCLGHEDVSRRQTALKGVRGWVEEMGRRPPANLDHFREVTLRRVLKATYVREETGDLENTQWSTRSSIRTVAEALQRQNLAYKAERAHAHRQADLTEQLRREGKMDLPPIGPPNGPTDAAFAIVTVVLLALMLVRLSQKIDKFLE